MSMNPSALGTSGVEPARPHAGKRLSPLRVLLGIVVVAAVAAVVVFGFRIFVVDQARAGGVAPWFAGYADVTATPQYTFESPPTDAQADVVLSFIVAQSAEDCTPSWGTFYGLDEAAQQLDVDRRIARLDQLGGDVIVSFGSATNTELATACTDTTQLAAAYAAVVDRYELSTIDLDIEGDDLTDTVAGQRRAEAIATLQAERRAAGSPLAVWLTLPVAPDGLTADGRYVVSQMLAAGVDLAGVNIMTMDYGVDLGGRTMGQTAIDALNATHAQLDSLYTNAGTGLTDATIWAKLGATPMLGQNDLPGEVFGLDDAVALNAFAQEKQLGRLSAWSLNRDAPCGPNYLDVQTVSDQCSGVDQTIGQFATVLATGFGGSPDATSAEALTAATPSPTATPSSGAADAPGRRSNPLTDDPATSPYPVWSRGTTYLAGAKTVWHGTVYEAKWWTLGEVPDEPVQQAGDTAWKLIGPVLPGETPYTPNTVPVGTYPDWSGEGVYQEGDRVLFKGVPYEAKWWTQGDSPAATKADSDGSPWVPLTAAQVADVRAETSATPTPAP